MKKLNSIGVRAKDIDRIFGNAIAKIARGEQEFSCCAIGTWDQHNTKQIRVRKFYAYVLAPRPRAKGLLDLLFRVTDHVGRENNDESQGFRILMLSLVKAAWRDLV